MVHYLATNYYYVFLFVVFQFFTLNSSSDLLSLHRCSIDKTFTANSAYQFNLDALLVSLSTAATTLDFYNTTIGGSRDTRDTVYGLFSCRGDVPRQTCQECVAEGTKKVASKCESEKEGMIWLDWCFIRYSDHSFFSLVEKDPRLGIFSISNITNSKSFVPTLAETLSHVVEEAANGGSKKFAVKRARLSNIAESESLFATAECTRDLSTQGCRTCLRYAIGDVTWCCLGKAGGRVAYPSCGIRFELYPFTWDIIAPAKAPLQENKKGVSRTIILIVVLLVVAAMLLSSFCCYLLWRKARKNNQKSLLRENFGHESVTLEGLQFDLAIIEEATKNFSPENMIGKGGFGKVYKGILCDGRHIAVKRLSTTSTQGAIEFKNEISLIAKLQHRNLVALVGFCLEVQEKILIYEYMSNGSLDNYLFGLMLDLTLFSSTIRLINSFCTHDFYKNVLFSSLIHLINIAETQPKILSWSKRYKIIEGTARGILYLHEYSRLKIIHRDLKPSNILLDENMNPKISDFGMARIIDIDQDRDRTKRIVGTYGYMSPEYAMLGQFSEKSDAFSFGVMILEIITGKRNINSHESHGNMNYVWRQWKEEKPLSILDPNLKDYSHHEVIKCIQIGLLCVQENQNIRPTMRKIVSYLEGHTLELPLPQEPSFFLRDKMDRKIVTQHFSINEMPVTTFCPR